MTIRADFPAAVLVHVEEAASTSTETDRMSLSIRRVSLRDAPVNCGDRYGPPAQRERLEPSAAG
jgi:hypothetical protein